MTFKNFIWIRHAEKKFSNGWGSTADRQHDPGIVENITPINNLVDNLVYKYGPPDKIICSPFLRTRQTSTVIKNRLLEKHNKDTKIIISNEVKEYLGFCKNYFGFADIDLQTEKFLGGPIKTDESINSLEKRVASHIQRLIAFEENVWIITHGIVMSYIYKTLTTEEAERPEPLNYLVYKNNQIIKNF